MKPSKNKSIPQVREDDIIIPYEDLMNEDWYYMIIHIRNNI